MQKDCQKYLQPIFEELSTWFLISPNTIHPCLDLPKDQYHKLFINFCKMHGNNTFFFVFSYYFYFASSCVREEIRRKYKFREQNGSIICKLRMFSSINMYRIILIMLYTFIIKNLGLKPMRAENANKKFFKPPKN